MMFTGLKVTGVSFIMSILLSYMLWFWVSINSIFFEVRSFPGFESLREAYTDFIFSEIADTAPLIALFFIFLFFSGVYLGKLLLRPFEAIGEYCEKAESNPLAPYEPDMFSDFRLLTRFSEFFFSFIIQCREEKAMRKNTIPPQFQKIRKPVFDKIFFLHFMLYTAIICSISIVILTNLTLSLYEQMVRLTMDHLQLKEGVTQVLLSAQSHLLDSIFFISICMLVSSYMALSIHLYSKVSGAAFGFFSTMKAFMKGNYNARVHLIGYAHVRPSSRKFNKYLDFIQRNFADHKGKQEVDKLLTISCK